MKKTLCITLIIIMLFPISINADTDPFVSKLISNMESYSKSVDFIAKNIIDIKQSKDEKLMKEYQNSIVHARSDINYSLKNIDANKVGSMSTEQAKQLSYIESILRDYDSALMFLYEYSNATNIDSIFNNLQLFFTYFSEANNKFNIFKKLL